MNWYIDREGDRFKRLQAIAAAISVQGRAAMLRDGPEAGNRVMTVLYRCPTPTNYLCACGKTARKLKSKGIDFDQVRVPYRRSDVGRSRT